MTNKVVFVADFFADQINGGGELNNEEAILLLRQRGYNVEKRISTQVTTEYIDSNEDCFFIIANFIGLQEDCKTHLLESNHRYVIYEHDHKYLKTRDPSYFDEYVAPSDQIINVDFYAGASAVFCQSKLHKQVAQKNLKTNNIQNLGGNLWSKDILSQLSLLSKKEKKDRYSIWNSHNPIKSTNETIAYCSSKGIPFDLVGNLSYSQFLNKLSNNNTFIFMPKTLETLCRVVVEARMCGMKVVTNKKVGATSEEWFSLKGVELIQEMENKREEIIDKIEKVIT